MRYEEKVYATKHSTERANERMCIKNPREYNRMIQLVFERGKRACDMRRSADRTYLSEKTKDGVVAVAFTGFCFIFSEAGACVTLFRLPSSFGKSFHDVKEYSTRRYTMLDEYDLYA